MAHPRRVVPGETYLVTRRCCGRAFRLPPGALTNGVLRYCLAFAAKRTGVLVHAVCVMSNHHHLVVTDVHGQLPIFLRELHRLSAKALNAAQGQWENLWAAEPGNAVRLVTDEDVDDKIAYVVANPVAAGLVEQPEAWPGLVLWGDQKLKVERPNPYFRAEGKCPAELELTIEPPRSRGEGSVEPTSWRQRVGDLIAAKVAAAHGALRERRKRFSAEPRAPASSVPERARSREARFGIVPTFAAMASAVRDALRDTERAFRSAYRVAFHRWRGGEREVRFPEGTWGMVVVHGAAEGALPGGRAERASQRGAWDLNLTR